MANKPPKPRRKPRKKGSSPSELRDSISKTGIVGGGWTTLIENKDKEDVVKELSNTVASLPIEHIKRNPDQPRVDFDETALKELAESIVELGIIQPITVRYVAENEYQIISGERRWRASKLADLKEIPAFIRIADDKEMMEMALVENIQREDLNPWEIANTYERLTKEFKLTQQEVSERVGKKRSTVANYLGLLKIENPEITKALKEGKISMGHGRELVTIDDSFYQDVIFKNITRAGLSVRATEKLAKLFKDNRDVFIQVNDDSANPKLKNSLTIGELSFEQVLELSKVDIHVYQNYLIDKIDDKELTIRELRDFVDFYAANRKELEVAAKNIANINELQAEELQLEHLKEIGRLSDQGHQDLVRAQTIKKNLTFLQTANLVDSYLGLTKPKNKPVVQLDGNFDQAQQKLKKFLGSSKINIKLKEDGTGQIIIPFEEDNKVLNELIALIEFAKKKGFDSNK